jgi:5'-nucleotidase / UDP-sugar diphosphatase
MKRATQLMILAMLAVLLSLPVGCAEPGGDVASAGSAEPGGDVASASSAGPGGDVAPAGSAGPGGDVAPPGSAGPGGDGRAPRHAGAAAPGATVAAAGELHVTLLHTGDEHSAVLPAPLADYAGGEGDPTRGGFARLATVIQRLRGEARARGEPTLLTSAGDFVSGTPFAWLLLEGLAPELGLMVQMGYDVVTLGNHEFDYDSDYLAGYIAAAGFPSAARGTAIVAANTHAPPGHPLGALGIEPTHLVELPNGLRVGFFGLIGRGASRFATGAAPVTFSDAGEAAARSVAELRQAGAHLVVALTHSGVAEDRQLARSVAGIDVILGGHDHVLLEEPLMEGSTVIVHPGAHARQVVALQLAYDVASGSVRVRNRETGVAYVVPVDAGVPPDPATAARVAEHRARLEALVAFHTGGGVAALDATVARAAFPLRAGPPMEETPFGNFVTDAMRRAAEEATGLPVDFAFQANGVIRGDLPAGTGGGRSGEMVFHDLGSAVGMGRGPDGTPGYPLVAVWLTGEEVRRVLEISVLLSELLRNSYFLQASGVHMEYDPRRAILFRIPFRGTPIPTGRAVRSARRVTGDGGVPLLRGDTALYHVVTDYYVASFLPMVGDMLPRLALVPRDRHGRPVADMAEAVIRRDGRELKTWQAVLEHAGGQAIPDRYAAPEGRLVQVRVMPLWLLPALALLLLAVLTGGLLAGRRRRGAAS